MKIVRPGFLLRLVLACTVPAALCHGQCEVLKLTGPPPDPYYARFGFSVSLQGERMAVGKPNSVALAGSIDVFERQGVGTAWVPVATLVASDGEQYDEFGYSVAVDEQTLVVGATDHGLLGAKGAAYVFERQADGTWVETAKLLASDDSAWAFGWSVDIDGDRIAVGAKGASALSGGKGMAFIFEREAGAWVAKATIKPPISAGGDGFGASLDLEGERIVVGAPYAWTSWSPFEGLAFVFERHFSGAVWIPKAILSPPDLQDNDQFGRDVALDGDRIVVGVPLYDQPSPFIGGAFVFDLIGGTWTQTGILSPGDQPILSDFGWSVDVEGNQVLVGARSDGSTTGAVYRFEEDGSGWNEVAKFSGSGTAPGDAFGMSVDLEGAETLIGAPFIWSEFGHPGAAFLITLDPAGPSLLAEATSASLSQGGAQSFQLGACPEHAGDLYLLAGSATGTSPGFAFGGLPIPLNPDVYFLYTLNHPGTPPLATSFGVLDAWGKGSASFSLPPGSEPALAGLTLHHAYAVLDAATLQLETVSPPVPVALVP